MLQARQYVRLVLEQNTTMNLTGATNEDEAFQMHIEDSLALLPVLDAITKRQTASRQEDATLLCSILDVGSGGGLPGVILAIARPDWQVTLLDSLRKRCIFVEKAIKEVGVQNTNVVWARAEEAGQSQQHREVYDIAVARAVAKMRVLAELCLPFVKPGGHWLAAKGPDCEAEVVAAENAIRVLQGGPPSITPVNAFGSSGQHVAVVVQKVAATPAQYPRHPGKPNKRPL
ncbi:TPA: hypothetical protein ACH3X3_002516 [Trebouxia sp. C0006]